MIVVLILLLFLTLSFYVLEAFNDSISSHKVITTLYQKERALLLSDSLLGEVATLLNNLGSIVHLNQQWAKPIKTETPIGEIEVEIVDLDRFLNVNTINRPLVYRAMRRLCTLLDIDPRFLERLKVWEGLAPKEGFSFPYPVKGGKLDSLWELTYIWNNTGDLFGKKEGFIEYPGLMELLTIYSDGRVNINTAPYWILRSLDEAIDDWTAREIIEKRREKPFKNMLDLLGVGNIDMDTLYRIRNLIKFSSRYFKITISVKSGDIKFNFSAVYDRQSRRFVERTVR